jgi:predicted metal-dependent hydrolase
MKAAFKIDRIVRSRRKTVALYVLPDGSLEVRAPMRLSLSAIYDFTESKTSWIECQRTRLAKMVQPESRQGYANGSRIWLLGKVIALEFSQNHLRRIKLDQLTMLVPANPPERIEAHLVNWYRAQARRVINERVEFYASRHNLRCSGVRINSARRRWGSCGANDGLNFPYRLVMAPLEIIDYVVVHELVHTAVRNHGPAFWARVAAILPDYRQRRQWLRLNGALLDLSFEADPDRITPLAPVKPTRVHKTN